MMPTKVPVIVSNLRIIDKVLRLNKIFGSSAKFWVGLLDIEKGKEIKESD